MITETLIHYWILGFSGIIFHFIFRWADDKRLQNWKKEVLGFFVSSLVVGVILYSGESKIEEIMEVSSKYGNIGIIVFGYTIKSNWRKLKNIFDSLSDKLFGWLLSLLNNR